MITKEKYGGITWVDLDSPTDDELDQIQKEYAIHSLTTAELAAPSQRSKVDPYKNYIYAIFHFPNIHHEPHELDNREIDFILGKKFIITCHYQETPVLDRFRKEVLPERILGEYKSLPHAGYIFFHLMRFLYQSNEDHLDEIEADLDEIEENIFSGHEKEMVAFLGVVSHDIIDIKQALKPHKSILESLEMAGRNFYGDEFAYYLRAINGEYEKVWNLTEDTREMLHELRDTNDSLLSAKTNEVMKVLTILAFITFPLSLLAGIFGMNTHSMPVVGSANDFWVVVGIMIAASLGMILFFRYKKWL